MATIEGSKEFFNVTFFKISQIILILGTFTINSNKSTEESFIEILSYSFIGLAISEASNNSRLIAELLRHQVVKRSQIIMRGLQTLVACILVLLAMLIFDSNIAHILIIILILSVSFFSFVSVILRGLNKLYWSQVIWVTYWLVIFLLQIQCDTIIAFVISSSSVALFSAALVYNFVDFEFDYVSSKLVRATLILGATGIIDAIVRRVDLLILSKMASSAELSTYYLLQKNFDLFNQASQVLKTVYLNLKVIGKHTNLSFLFVGIIWSFFMLCSYIFFKFLIFEYFSSYTFNTAIFFTFGLSGLFTYLLTPIGLNKILKKKYEHILLSSAVCFIVSCSIWWVAVQIVNLEVFALALPVGIVSQILVLKIMR